MARFEKKINFEIYFHQFFPTVFKKINFIKYIIKNILISYDFWSFFKTISLRPYFTTLFFEKHHFH